MLDISHQTNCLDCVSMFVMKRTVFRESISDMNTGCTYVVGTMLSLLIMENLWIIVCDTSLLKATDYRLKKKSIGYKMCDRCELGIIENARHLILQCSFYDLERTDMFKEIESVNDTWSTKISNQGYDLMHILLGMLPEGINFDEMKDIWLIAGSHISRMYLNAITGRR